MSGANLAAPAAEPVSLAAVPIVAVLALNAGPGEIGLLNTAQSLPFLLLSIALGLWVNRHSRRQLMVAAEVLRALSLAALLAATASGQLSLMGLALLGFIGASGTVGFSVAAPALVPALVPRMRSLGLGAQAVGLTLTTCGAGMLLGALAAPRILAALPFGTVVVVGPAMSVLAMATMVATLRWPSGGLAGCSFFLFGAGPILWTISSTTLRQTVTPQAMLGRVSSIFLTVNMGARPLGATLGGLVGAQWGAGTCLVLALARFCVQAAVILGSPVRGLRQLPPHA